MYGGTIGYVNGFWLNGSVTANVAPFGPARVIGAPGRPGHVPQYSSCGVFEPGATVPEPGATVPEPPFGTGGLTGYPGYPGYVIGLLSYVSGFVSPFGPVATIGSPGTGGFPDGVNG